MIDVKIAERQGAACVVEYTGEDGLLHRAIVPKAAIRDGKVNETELAYGVPQDGVDLLAFLPDMLTLPAWMLQNELRRAGVWTRADYLSKPAVIAGVLQRLYGADVASLQTIATKELS